MDWNISIKVNLSASLIDERSFSSLRSMMLLVMNQSQRYWNKQWQSMNALFLRIGEKLRVSWSRWHEEETSYARQNAK